MLVRTRKKLDCSVFFLAYLESNVHYMCQKMFSKECSAKSGHIVGGITLGKTREEKEDSGHG
jgi:hypothetical protein